jgi:hypothetical protein
MVDHTDVGVTGSKNYDIKTLELINSGGQTVDLRKVFIELQICQDLFSSVMSGNILIDDGHDIFSNFYFCGNEYLNISIDKPSLGKPIEKIFRVYSSTKRRPTGESAQMYLLNFCSEEMIFSNSKLVSKAYKSQKTVDIIRDVLVNELKVDISKIKTLEPTSGTYDYVVPNYRPLEVIQWAASRSYDASKKFCYFFYEDRDGFQFKSYNTLTKQKPYKTLKYELKTVDQDPAVNKDSIDKFRILNDFNILTSLSNGSFASKLLSVDIFSQQFKTDVYSIDVAEGQQNLLNKFKPINGLKNQDNLPITTSYDAFFRTYISINDTASEKSNDIKLWMMNRALHMSLMHNFRIEIVIPGDILLKAGEVVKYEFPRFEGADSKGKATDEYRTGNYLVSAINHKFTGGDKGDFESIVELVSDSVSKQIPGAKEGINKVVKKVQ